MLELMARPQGSSLQPLPPWGPLLVLLQQIFPGAAAGTSNYVTVGIQGTAGTTQAGDAVNPLAGAGAIAGSVNADGNPHFFIGDNPPYNQGFDKRIAKTINNAVKTIWIPLRFQVNALEAMKDAESGMAIDLTLRRPMDAETMFSANNAAAGNAITAPIPQYAAVNIVNLQLLIPAYSPSDFWKNKMVEKLNHGALSVRKYIDCDVILATTQLAPLLLQPTSLGPQPVIERQLAVSLPTSTPTTISLRWVIVTAILIRTTPASTWLRPVLP